LREINLILVKSKINMKNTLAFLSLIILASCGSNEVVMGNKTTIEVNKSFQAGKVMKGEIIKAKFIVKNTGDYPLIIGDVVVACSCTLASKPEEPIAPGDSAVIEATVDTGKTGGGAINKSVTIVANTVPSSTVVVINATVK
jgi:hypothetical protein